VPRSAAFALSVAVALGVAVEGAPLDREAIREASAAARESYDRKDYAAFLRHSRALVELVPRSTRALYNLACAQSLTGDAEGAVATLDLLAGWDVAFDLDADADLDPIREAEGYRVVAARMAALEEPMERSQVAFTLPERDMLAEGVAYDPVTGDFFVTAVHRRKVVRVDPEGRVRDFVEEGADGLLSAVGAVADPARRALWVSSGASRFTRGLGRKDEGRSFLLEYDLDDGGLRRRIPPPVEGGTLSDLALGPDGAVYAADPAAGRVYRLLPGSDRLEVLVDEGAIFSAQGMAISPDGRFLFVADYLQGIARVDLDRQEVAFLQPPEDLLVSGIDGLLLAGDSLVGIQNGLRPHRVVRLELDPAHSRITGGSVLERAHRRFDEPTLGVVVGDALYYVANSQYGHFDENGSPDLERLREPVVLRLTLPWLAGGRSRPEEVSRSAAPGP
jgi:sugar lactone lactonase YvrE